MPILKSAIKRMRQNSVRRDRRKPVKSLMKTMVKAANEAAGAKKLDADQLALSYKAIDMAAKKGIIHRKTASRKKSSLAKLLTK